MKYILLSDNGYAVTQRAWQDYEILPLWRILEIGNSIAVFSEDEINDKFNYFNYGVMENHIYAIAVEA
ncbi:MAG: hypothetical protein QXV17_07625 [Candidatus Micrarchaeaceae archaeon]